MSELDADFIISNNNALEVEYEISEGQHFDCSFEIYAAGATFSNIAGSPYDNEALASALNQKADSSTVEALSETVDSNYNTLDGKIDTHIADKTNPHEVTKAQVGLGNVDNTSDLNKPISTATQTALNGKQNTISDLSEIRSNASNGQSAYNTIQNYGDIVTYDASFFATSVQGQKADTALQPNDNISELNNDVGYITMSALGDYATLQELENGLATKQDTINDLSDIRNDASEGASAYSTISGYGDIVNYNSTDFASAYQGELADTALQPNDDITELNNNAGYITSASLPTVNNSTIKFQKNGSDIETITLNQSGNSTVNYQIPTQASDINAVPTSRKVNNKALSSDITLSASDVSALPSSTTINDLTTSTQQDALNSGATSTNIRQIATNTSDITAIEGLIPVQATTTNQLADKSFVNSSIATNTANFIGTFNSVAEMEAYSGTLTNNDYAFVETTDSAGNTLYDRYKYTTATTPASWQFEYELNNSSFTSNQWAAINSGANTNNIGQIATNANDISDINTTIGGYGDIVTYNASSFATSAQGTKADTALQSGDNVSELNNNANYITTSDLSGYATETWVNNQGFITGINSSDVTNALGFTPYDSNNPDGFISSITSSDVTTALGYTPYNSSNPNGYTSNVGTVTSVNNIQPDANGNVTISSGSSTDVQINGTSITSGGVANILTNTAYNASSNKIATMSDLPSISGLANTDLSNLSATGEAHFLKNESTGTNSITILGTPTSAVLGSTNVGYSSTAANSGTSYGYIAQASGGNSTAIGSNATASGNSAIQIGSGTNSTGNSLSVGFTQASKNWQLLDGTTGYIPNGRLIGLLETIYPVGSVYLSTNSTCPLASLFGTWTLVSSGRALWTGTGSNGNTTIAAGLPNITGETSNSVGRAATKATTKEFDGSISRRTASSSSAGYQSSATAYNVYVGIDASKSSTIYSSSVSTVQPPAYVVNVWRRTA